MSLAYRSPAPEQWATASPFGRRTLAVLGVVLPLLAGCEAPPIAWEDARPAVTTAGQRSADSALVPPTTSWPGDTGDPSGEACLSSARYARVGAGAAGDSRWYVAWWRARRDGSARLMIARSDDGGAHWNRPASVDTVDVSRLGCSRPAPGITADERGGYVHLAYFMNAPEGAGIFFAHSMDASATFHAPVAVVYGDRPSAASVAASGDTVAVAYLDPNALRPFVALALSYTAGHVFERHALMVSGSGGAAEEPRVTLRGREIEVSWLARHAGATTPDAPGMTFVRRGALR